MSKVLDSHKRHMQDRVLQAAERVAQAWDNHGKAEYFAQVYEAVAAELAKDAAAPLDQTRPT